MANCSQINNTTIKGTSAVTYDSTPLPCTDVDTCNDLNTILTKFDNVICAAIANVAILIEEVTNLTEDVMIITEDIISITNQINICCAPIYNCVFDGYIQLPIYDCIFNGYITVPTTTTTTTQGLNCVINGYITI